MSRFQFDLNTLWKLLHLVYIVPGIGIILVILFGRTEFDKLGPYGDFIAGSTVPILTFISFLAVVITLRMQKEQLEMQREELRNSIEEMQETRKEFIEQNKTMRIQRFENTFFQMVSLHNEIVDSVTTHDGRKGRNAFYRIFDDLCIQYDFKKPAINLFDELDIIRDAYNALLKDYEDQLGHYYRNLYRIVKFIDESDIDDKNVYIEIIKAQLSSYELALLLYYGLSSSGTDFLHYIKNYNLLENLSKNRIINISHLNLFDHMLVKKSENFKTTAK